MAENNLDRELAELETMDLPQLRSKWCKTSDHPAPKISATLLRLALAWELQAAAYGGLSRQTRQKLDQIANGKTQTRAVQPGMRLMREWNGIMHVVTVDDDGAIHWNGQHWSSLSKVARAITGTRWSGPAFFGLKKKRAA